MDSGIVVSLVLGVLFFGGMFWLVAHSRRQVEKDTTETSIKPPEPKTKSRAA